MISTIKNSNNQERNLIRTIKKIKAKRSLKKINDQKKLYFEENIAEIKSKAKELWRTWKSIDMRSKGGDNLKYH